MGLSPEEFERKIIQMRWDDMERKCQDNIGEEIHQQTFEVFGIPNEIEWGEQPDYGELMTMSEFVGGSKNGLLINDDGYGLYASENKATNVTIKPSDITDNYYNDEYTHVVWFNR